MDKIIFGIPSRRVVHRVTLTYAALIIQEAPIEKGKAFKMQLSDPAIRLMNINLDVKSSVAVASLGENVFLIPVTPEVKEKVPEKDVCMVYADGSLSNKRLYMYLSKLFSLDTGIKNTFTIERATVNSGVPGVEPVIMFKLARASTHDRGQTSQEATLADLGVSGASEAPEASIPASAETDAPPDVMEDPTDELGTEPPIRRERRPTRSPQSTDTSSSLPPNEVEF